jgi:DNA-binding NtrC family response regulator
MLNPTSFKPRVLIVDDQVNWQEVLVDLLSPNCEVAVASDFDQAESLLKSENFHVLVLDMRLVDQDKTNQDGLRILEKARHRGDYETGVIVVSGYATKEMVARFKDTLQVLDYFRKGEIDAIRFQQFVYEAAHQAISLKSDLSPRRYRVLVVEDDVSWREDLVEILGRDGYQVDSVSCSGDAIQKLDEDIYHLVIVDLNLDSGKSIRLQGKDLLRTISASRFRVEVIVVTGVPSAPIVIEAVGFDNVRGVFHKSQFNIEAFRKAVDSSFASVARRYVEAWFEDHESDKPLEIGREYTLIVSVRSARSEPFQKRASIPIFLIPTDHLEELEIVLFAEDMEILPSRYQVLDLPPKRVECSISFQVIPQQSGQKDVNLDLYQEDNWLANLRLKPQIVAVLEGALDSNGR